MRFLVAGAGAVGCHVGARLAEDGNEVMFMERDPVHSALRAHGVRIESKKGPLVVKKPDIYADPGSAGYFDVVLVCVRASETESIIDTVRPLLSFDCAVISLQSGVDATHRLREAFGDRHVMPGLVRVAVEPCSAAVMRELHPAPAFSVGEFDDHGSWRLECILIAFQSAGFTATTGEDMLVEQWRNFLLEAALASSTASSGLGVRQLILEDEHRDRVLELLAEGVTIAAAEGIEIKNTPEQLLSSAESGPGEVWLHMQRDLAAGRPIENAALAGAMSRRASRLGVTAPAWTTLYEALDSRAPSASSGRGTSIPPVRAG
jgi:2-dehydropantoate 2-reductase